MSELSEHPDIVAKELGLRVVLPADNELFLDIDDAKSMEHYLDMLTVLDENNIKYETRATESAGGNNHIYVTLATEVSPQLRIALQAALGSDRKRELLSALRIMLHLDCPATVFFEVPSAETKV